MPAYTFINVQQMVGKDTYQTINIVTPGQGRKKQLSLLYLFFYSSVKHVSI